MRSHGIDYAYNYHHYCSLGKPITCLQRFDPVENNKVDCKTKSPVLQDLDRLVSPVGYPKD